MSEDEAATLQGYADLMGFGHSRERVVELEEEVKSFMADIQRLWDIDVEGYEMAVSLDLSSSW